MKWFFIILILTYLAANAYIYARGLQSLPHGAWRTVFSVIFVAALSSLFTGMFFEDRFPVCLTSILQTAGGIWLISLVYLVAIVLFIDIVCTVNRFLHFLPDFLTVPKIKPCMFCLVLAALAAILTAGAIKFNNPTVYELEIATEKQECRIPRIVAVSDIHLGYVIGRKKLHDFVNLINRQNPDIVLLCGDTFDRSARPVENAGMTELLRQIRATHGVYAILGNHEYYGDTEKLTRIFHDAGIVLLKDSIAQPVEGLYIIGRDDYSNRSRKSLPELMQNIDGSKFTVLLDHQPRNLDEAMEAGIDMQFSGHTHDGQIFPVNIIARKIFEKSYGYYRKGNTQYYVTSGLGLWGAPLRIGTRSEIVVLNVKNTL